MAHIRAIKPDLRGIQNWSCVNGVEARWKDLGLALGLQQHNIQVLDMDNRTVRDASRSMFSLWIQRTVGINLGMLIDACFEIGLEDAARNLMENAEQLFMKRR